MISILGEKLRFLYGKKLDEIIYAELYERTGVADRKEHGYFEVIKHKSTCTETEGHKSAMETL